MTHESRNPLAIVVSDFHIRPEDAVDMRTLNFFASLLSNPLVLELIIAGDFWEGYNTNPDLAGEGGFNMFVDKWGESLSHVFGKVNSPDLADGLFPKHEPGIVEIFGNHNRAHHYNNRLYDYGVDILTPEWAIATPDGPNYNIMHGDELAPIGSDRVPTHGVKAWDYDYKMAGFKLWANTVGTWTNQYFNNKAKTVWERERPNRVNEVGEQPIGIMGHTHHQEKEGNLINAGVNAYGWFEGVAVDMKNGDLGFFHKPKKDFKKNPVKFSTIFERK